MYTEYNGGAFILRRYLFNEGKREGEFIEERKDYICKGIFENDRIVELINTNKNSNIIVEKKYKHPNYNENNLLCVETYYESGKIKEIYSTTIMNKHNKYIKYYESGQKETECVYINGTYTGEYYNYYASGRICQYTNYGTNKGIEIESIRYYDRDINNIYNKRNGKKFVNYGTDGLLNRFEYSESPNIVIKYSIESHYYEKNKEEHKKLLKEFALDLLKSLE